MTDNAVSWTRAFVFRSRPGGLSGDIRGTKTFLLQLLRKVFLELENMEHLVTNNNFKFSFQDFYVRKAGLKVLVPSLRIVYFSELFIIRHLFCLRNISKLNTGQNC